MLSESGIDTFATSMNAFLQLAMNSLQTNIARLSNLYRDVPQFKNTLDILV